jgi:hypothetical protein
MAEQMSSAQAESMMLSLRSTLQDLQIRSNKVDLNKNKTQLFGFLQGPSNQARESIFGADSAELGLGEKLRRINYSTADQLQRLTNGVTHDLDRRFVDVGPMIAEGIAQSKVGYEDGLKKVIKELILHEYGHFSWPRSPIQREHFA